MSSDDTPDMTHSLNALGRIAEALGCPVERLYGEETGPESGAQLAELIRLWFAIDVQDARDRILTLARALASGQDGAVSSEARR